MDYDYQVDLNTSVDYQSIDWEMDEYLEHKRNLAWYAVLIIGSLVLGSLSYLVTGGELIPPIAILIMGVVVCLYSFKKPSHCRYSLTETGLKIDSRFYDYSSFKTFSLVKDNGVAALYLIANRRFRPPLTVYLPLDKDKHIVQTLSQHIAYTPGGLLWIDRLMQYLRF